MSIREEIEAANERYASGFTKGELPMPPARRFAVVTCMDARLDPAKFLGLEDGDAHVIRNAGGLVSEDALRSDGGGRQIACRSGHQGRHRASGSARRRLRA